jgi:hypothetical protein
VMRVLDISVHQPFLATSNLELSLTALYTTRNFQEKVKSKTQTLAQLDSSVEEVRTLGNSTINRVSFSFKRQSHCCCPLGQARVKKATFWKEKWLGLIFTFFY